ncbi:uncharacterized protein IL334_002489 [Kwoniella shivajii]|uniref:Wax synthase domain-containing protein n=1 Tax=Kwoniella shivajii TaxID=564305 RepID=A0ABZ1CUW4_9TREE|nr:hypothetical protein IL334_002489 [Kwoniella shivajii]
MIPILFSSSNPFGPFQSIHEHVIRNAEPLSWDNWYHLFIIPLIPLYCQTLLLRYEWTRQYRIALGVMGIAMLWAAGMKYRFVQPWFNALNNGIGIGIMHITARYAEFGFMKGPLYDRYFEAKGRNPLISALDVAVNARWIGLGVIDLDHQGKVDNVNINTSAKSNGQLKNGISKGDGGIRIDSNRTIPDLNNERNKESWLPWPKVKRTRTQAFIRHLSIAIKNYIIFDTFLYMIRYFGSNTIGSNLPVSNALYRFSHENTFIIFPSIHFFDLEDSGQVSGRKQMGMGTGIIAPWYLVEFAVELSVAVGVWLGISAGYHFLGAICVGTGFWETESWEIDLFDNPLKADSLLDFWGRRWHQFFRHHFILYSSLILGLLKLPRSSGNILFLSFILSGAMHSLGQWSMSPNPPLLPLFALFPLSGLGCILEVLFKRYTGKKVGGIWGRIWTWSAMLLIGRLGTIAWVDSGVGGSYLTPPWAGPIIVKWAEKWLIAKA